MSLMSINDVEGYQRGSKSKELSVLQLYSYLKLEYIKSNDNSELVILVDDSQMSI